MICFLFFKNLTQKTCFSTVLDPLGQEVEALCERSFEEIQQLQSKNITRTIIVINSELCSIFELNLPKLSVNNANATIPYALEETLADNIEDLHFAFDKKHYKNGKYLVAVINKMLLKNFFTALEASNISFDEATIDWFALKEGEAFASYNGVLVYDIAFKGWISPELLDLYFKKFNDLNSELNQNVQITKRVITGFRESKLKDSNLDIIDESFYIFIAKRLITQDFINLCHGDLQRHNKYHSTKIWYKYTIAFGVAFLSIFFLHAGLKIYFLNHEITQVDKEIAILYKKFFPEAQKVISPKFRVEQLMKQNKTDNQGVWLLIDELGKSLGNYEITIEKLTFNKQVLTVTLLTKDFLTLENLSRALKLANIDVTQKQAQSQDQKVLAILELKT